MIDVLSRKRAWSQFLLLAVLIPSVGFGDEKSCSLSSSNASAGGVVVNIRTVRALDKTDSGEPGDKAQGAQEGIDVDGRLKDLSSKLQKLHFRTFKLIASQREILRFGRKEVVSLSDGNTVMLRPLSMENNKVGLWVRWQDGSGMQVIDTRLHFAPGESIITGVDASGESGLILAIDVNPYSAPDERVAEPVSAQ